MELQEVDVEIGASTAEIADILANEISITVGAGEATVEQLTVDKLNVEAGLGAEQNVKYEGATKSINVECGIGEVKVKFQK